MLTETDLRELVAMKATAPVLSVYLNTNPAEGNADAYRLRLRSMLKEVNLPQDVAAVERYFTQEYGWSGRGVAVFSCAGQNYLRAFPLAVPVRDLVHVGERPSVKPLADLFENYGGYGVALVDKQGARMFFFHLGELREQEGVLGDPVKHTKSGGSSSKMGVRGGVAKRTDAMEEVVERNMKDSVDFAVHFFEEKHVRRVLIGGTDDNIAQFRNLLPKAWQSLVVGSFAMSMAASQNEVLTRAMQVGQEAEALREARLIKDLIVTAAKGGGALTGLLDSLKAVSNDRVQTLVVLEGAKAAGQRCTQCGHLTDRAPKVCPACEGVLEPVADVLDAAVSTVMRHGGYVEVAHTNPDLERFEGVGVFLRY